MSYGAPYGYGSGYGYGVTGGYNPFADSSLFALLAYPKWYQERTGLSATTPSGDGDPVGTIVGISGSKFVIAPADSSRPTLDADGIGGLPSLLFDGSDDYLNAANLASFGNAASCVMVTVPLRISVGGARRQVVVFGNGTVDTQVRLFCAVDSTGMLTVSTRRLDGDSSSTLTASTGALASNTDYVCSWVVDYSTANARLRVNGVQVATSSSHGTSGITSATDSLRARIGASIGNSPIEHVSGRYGRGIGFWRFASLPTSEQILARERYIGRLNGIVF